MRNETTNNTQALLEKQMQQAEEQASNSEEKDLRAFLKLQYVPTSEAAKRLYSYCTAELMRELKQGENIETALFWVFCDVYNYGFIQGKRSERARRKNSI